MCCACHASIPLRRNFTAASTLHFPSLLASIEMIYQSCPDRIIVSTPGPVGILGMTMAAALGIECVCIYHTDFAAQAGYILQDESVSGMIQSGINKFYSHANHIKVPTGEYIALLESQHLDPKKMSLFKRGIEIPTLNPNPLWKKGFRGEHGIREGMTLLYAGRISKDKNIDFLLEVYELALQRIDDLNLVICGSGPDLEFYQDQCSRFPGVYFMGRLDQAALGQFYEFSDLFVFPSTTDTFGMVILEAQSWGLPALVSNIGGPQEIIQDQNTGFVLDLASAETWISRIETIAMLKKEDPNEYAMMRARCQQHVQKKFNWNEALFDLLAMPADRSEDQDYPSVPSGIQDARTENQAAPGVHYAKKVVA